MPIPGARFDLYHDYGAAVRFLVRGGAGASSAELQLAASAVSLPDDVDLTLSSGGGQITLLDVAADCQVDCTFTAVPDTIPVGPRYVQLVLVKAGKPKVVKTGTVMVRASLAA